MNKLVIVLTIFTLLSCSSSTQVSKTGEFIPPEQEALPDSLKFFPIDTLQSRPVRLITDREENKLIPNETAKGNFRIQIYASSSKSQASMEADKALRKQQNNVFLTQEGLFWKVQIGEFMTRADADRAKNNLRQNGWTDCWILDMKKNNTPAENKTPEIIKDIVPPKPVTSGGYQIQILATNNKNAAEQLKDNVEKLGLTTVKIIFKNGYWKVRLGNYTSKQIARNELGKIKDIGFVDAWVVPADITNDFRKNDTKNNEIGPDKKDVDSKTGKTYSIELSNSILKKDSDSIIERAKSILGVNPNLIFNQSLWRVRIGKYSNWDKVIKELERIKNSGFPDAFIVELKDQVN